MNRHGKRNLKKNVEKLELSVTSYDMAKEISKKMLGNRLPLRLVVTERQNHVRTGHVTHISKKRPQGGKYEN